LNSSCPARAIDHSLSFHPLLPPDNPSLTPQTPTADLSSAVLFDFFSPPGPLPRPFSFLSILAPIGLYPPRFLPHTTYFENFTSEWGVFFFCPPSYPLRFFPAQAAVCPTTKYSPPPFPPPGWLRVCRTCFFLPRVPSVEPGPPPFPHRLHANGTYGVPFPFSGSPLMPRLLSISSIPSLPLPLGIWTVMY